MLKCEQTSVLDSRILETLKPTIKPFPARGYKPQRHLNLPKPISQCGQLVERNQRLEHWDKLDLYGKVRKKMRKVNPSSFMMDHHSPTVTYILARP